MKSLMLVLRVYRNNSNGGEFFIWDAEIPVKDGSFTIRANTLKKA